MARLMVQFCSEMTKNARHRPDGKIRRTNLPAGVLRARRRFYGGGMRGGGVYGGALHGAQSLAVASSARRQEG